MSPGVEKPLAGCVTGERSLPGLTVLPAHAAGCHGRTSGSCPSCWPRPLIESGRTEKFFLLHFLGIPWYILE